MLYTATATDNMIVCTTWDVIHHPRTPLAASADTYHTANSIHIHNVIIVKTMTESDSLVGWHRQRHPYS
jgi:hypothetical protein